MRLLAKILSSKARSEIFRLLFDERQRELHVRAIERESAISYRGIQQELENLTRLDLLEKRRDGNRLYYKAKREHPLYTVICELVQKTVGVEALLKRALSDSRILVAFVFGSVARDETRAESDLDLVVIGNISLFDLSSLLAGYEKRLGREINPHVYKAKDFYAGLKKGNHFISRLMETEKRFIVGSSYELKQISKTGKIAAASDQ